MKRGKLKVEIMHRGFAWLDTWTHESMLDAANFVQIVETRQGVQVACPEEVAFQQWRIDFEQLNELAKPFLKSNYGGYLKKIKG
jgi:glucose-1-phosphate thymidylyltransferase